MIILDLVDKIIVYKRLVFIGNDMYEIQSIGDAISTFDVCNMCDLVTQCRSLYNNICTTINLNHAVISRRVHKSDSQQMKWNYYLKECGSSIYSRYYNLKSSGLWNT